MVLPGVWGVLVATAERTSIVVKLSDEPYLNVPDVLAGLSHLFPSISAGPEVWARIWLLLGGRVNTVWAAELKRKFTPDTPLIPGGYGQYVMKGADSGWWEDYLRSQVAVLVEDALEGEYLIPQRAKYEVVTDRLPPAVKLRLVNGVHIFISRTVIAVHVPSWEGGSTTHRVLAELSRYLVKKPLLMGPEPEKLYVSSPDLAGEFMMPDD